MYEQSHHDYPALRRFLSASSSACHGLLINTMITLITNGAIMPENWKLANAAIADMQMRRRDGFALDAKYTKELADAKAVVSLCVMMCCRWSSSVAHQSSLSVSA